MNELEDVYIIDSEGNLVKTEKVVKRCDKVLEDGEYTLGVQALIINANNQILLSQRSSKKQKEPNLWECNGGAVRSGESALESLYRELHEELGINIDISNAILFKTVKYPNEIKLIYLIRTNIPLTAIHFLDGEVADVKWVNISEYIDALETNQIVSNNDILPEDIQSALDDYNYVKKV